MSILQVLNDIQHSSIGQLIGESNHLVIAALQVVHVFGVLLLLASLTLISLRLLGLALSHWSLPSLSREPGRLLWIGLGLAAGSGVLMFISGPAHYFYNRAFQIKMVCLLCALAVHTLGFRRLAARESCRPLLTRAVVGLSLLLWFSVGIAGRAIGFI